MTPFQEFRLWARRAPNGQRGAAAVAAVGVLGLLIWAAVPIANSGSGGSNPVVDSGPIAVSSTPPTPAPKPADCTTATGPVNGVTDNQITIGVIIVEASGIATNADLGILDASIQRKAFANMIKSLNAAGGVDCHQIVADYVTANPADQSGLQGICLDLAQKKVFAVLDAGAFAAFKAVNCFGQHKLPYFGGYLLPNSQMAQWYPYLFELNSQDQVYRDMVVGLQQQGFFKSENGFTKLGYLYNDCHIELHDQVVQSLADAGVTADQTVGFNTGCTTAFTPGASLQQAILKFKHAGVTNVIVTGLVGDMSTFTNLAQAQHFKPKYGFGDDSLITTSYGFARPNPQNFDGAIAIAPDRNGEEKTPGTTQSAETMKCGQIIGYDLWKVGNAAGNVCDQMWMFAAAVTHAPTLSQTSLADGLHAAKAVPFAYPQAPNDFAAGSKVTYGGQYWRPVQFHASCTCWQLISQAFHPTPS
ncbi:MAG: hypothetical protein JO246_15110 [Frankiaceae bacterium]|nr:hypothetical protein [Frankiaceae bacterium]MBV9870631.1 hypothetical protein [Frankiaceae bacterium]